MWDIAERKLPSGCQLCREPIVKGDKIWVHFFKAYKQSRTIYIHAEHLIFHTKEQCKHRYKEVTADNNSSITCQLCYGQKRFREETLNNKRGQR